MNHLAHLYLARGSDHLLVGGFLGDFVKGPLRGARPHSVERGIALHRSIDAFTDRHPLVATARRALPNAMYRVSGIITDIVFDQCLANRWARHHSQGLDTFDRDVFDRLLRSDHLTFFPESALAVCKNMQTYRSLLRTLDNNYVERSLLNIGRRLKRGDEFFNPASLQELGPKLSPVEQIFDEFFASLKDFVDNWHIEHPE